MMVPLFIIASLLATCQGADYITFPLRMRSGDDIHYPPEVSCKSKMLAVEAHNLRNFKTIPQKCQQHVGNYLLSEQYQSDSKTVCVQAYYHALTLSIKENDIWIFGIDDAVLSSVPYYSENGFGVEPFNSTRWDSWLAQGVAPALPESRKLYGKLLELNIKIAFVTSRLHKYRDVTVANLKAAGFHSWEKLITRGPDFEEHVTEQEYKEAVRQQLVDEGYRIVGSIGDQWSDLLGENEGLRTFKLPNPIYYVE